MGKPPNFRRVECDLREGLGSEDRLVLEEPELRVVDVIPFRYRRFPRQSLLANFLAFVICSDICPRSHPRLGQAGRELAPKYLRLDRKVTEVCLLWRVTRLDGSGCRVRGPGLRPGGGGDGGILSLMSCSSSSSAT